LLNVADKLSGESSLTSMLANQKGGWGNQHHHRKSKPYTLPSDAASASF
jgi:hypothetical protein